MASTTSIAYPKSERRTAQRLRRASWILIPGLVLVSAAGFASTATGFLQLALSAVAIAGLALFSIGILLLILAQAGWTRELVTVARARTAPEGLPVRDSPPGEIRAGVVLRDSDRSATGSGFLLPVVSAGLAAIVCLAGLASLLLRWVPLSGTAALLLLLVAALVPVLLLLADVNRRPAGWFEGSGSPPLFLSTRGVEGPFFPYDAYQKEPEGYTLRSHWFGIVQARLPAPNRVPWRLLSVTVGRTHDVQNPALSFVSLSPAQIPWWMGGLKLGTGFLPEGQVGDVAIGFGLVLAIWRSQLEEVLWTAFRGGSRVSAEHGQLTDAGRAAARSIAGPGGTWMTRTLNGPWFVSLPPPSAPSDLSAWLT